MALAIFGVSHAAAEPKYVMPRELVEHAREVGCAQVDDFFDIDGMIGAPYVYGYIPGREEKSAAFWCQKTKGDKRQFFLAVMVAPRSEERRVGKECGFGGCVDTAIK